MQHTQIPPIKCVNCGKTDGIMRNWSAESMVSTFHPTRDLMAEKKRMDAKKSGT